MEKDDGLKILYFTVVDNLTFIKVESRRIYRKSYSFFLGFFFFFFWIVPWLLHIITNEPTKSRGVFFAP